MRHRKTYFQIGAHIRRVTADQIKKVSLELGGKNPASGAKILRLGFQLEDIFFS